MKITHVSAVALLEMVGLAVAGVVLLQLQQTGKHSVSPTKKPPTNSKPQLGLSDGL